MEKYLKPALQAITLESEGALCLSGDRSVSMDSDRITEIDE